MAEYNSPQYVDNPDVIRDLISLFNQINEQFIDTDENNEYIAQLTQDLQFFVMQQVKSLQRYIRIDESDSLNIGIIDGDLSDDTQKDPFDIYTDETPTNEGADGDYIVVYRSEEKTFEIWKNNSGTFQLVNENVSINVANFFIVTNPDSASNAYIFLTDWEPMTFAVDLSEYYAKPEIDTLLLGKQNLLVGSGANQNIKTVGGQNILGAGNIEVGGGTGSPSNFYGIIFGTQEDVNAGVATAVFSSLTFTSALNDDSITKIGLYGGNSSRVYNLDEAIIGSFDKQKVICATNGQVAITADLMYDNSCDGLNNHFYLQVSLPAVITTSATEKINYLNNTDVVAHIGDLSSREYVYSGSADLTDFFANKASNIFKTGGTLVLPAGTYTLGNIATTSPGANIQLKNGDYIDVAKWVPDNLNIVCRDGIAVIQYTGTSSSSSVLSLNDNCLLQKVDFQWSGNGSRGGYGITLGSNCFVNTCNISYGGGWSSSSQASCIYLKTGATGTTIKGSIITMIGSGGQLYGIYGNGNTGIKILNCNVTVSNSYTGSTAGYRAEGVSLIYSSGANISGCNVSAMSGTGYMTVRCVNIGYSAGAVIKDNTLTASSNLSTSANTIVQCISANEAVGAKIILQTTTIFSNNSSSLSGLICMVNCELATGCRISRASSNNTMTFKGTGKKSIVAGGAMTGVALVCTTGTPPVLSDGATTSNTFISATSGNCNHCTFDTLSGIPNFALLTTINYTTQPTTDYGRWCMFGSTYVS